MHDSGYGIRQFVKPGKFVANILCDKHNRDLHTADDAALAVAKFLFGISTQYRCGASERGEPEEITVSGDDFQAWVLKLILNHVVGKAFIHHPPKGRICQPVCARRCRSSTRPRNVAANVGNVCRW